MGKKPFRRDEGSIEVNLNAISPNSSVRPSEAASLKVQIKEGEILNERSKVTLTILIWGKAPPFVSIRERRVEVPHDYPFVDITIGKDVEELDPKIIPFLLGVGGVQV